MSFSVGDILFFNEYQFTDTGNKKRHYGLVLLPESATKYQESVYCCVITSKATGHWALELKQSNYAFFSCDSYACFNRKDLVSKSGLDDKQQPRGSLTLVDKEKAYKILKKSLFVIKDMANSPYFRAIIIYNWKKSLGKIYR